MIGTHELISLFLEFTNTVYKEKIGGDLIALFLSHGSKR